MKIELHKIKIKEVVVTSNRLQQFTSGNKIQTIDSTALKNNATNSLAELISSQTQIQINSYGPGALASPSFRGSGSSHTAVLWNGFNMQDILAGGVDFSQIPDFFLDDVKIQFAQPWESSKWENFEYRAGYNVVKAQEERRRAETLSHMGATPHTDAEHSYGYDTVNTDIAEHENRID